MLLGRPAELSSPVLPARGPALLFLLPEGVLLGASLLPGLRTRVPSQGFNRAVASEPSP